MAPILSENVALLAIQWTDKMNNYVEHVRTHRLNGDKSLVSTYEGNVDRIIMKTVKRVHGMCSLDYLMFKVYEGVRMYTSNHPEFVHASLEPPQTSAYPLVLGSSLEKRIKEEGNARRTITQYVGDITVKYCNERPFPLPPVPGDEQPSPAPSPVPELGTDQAVDQAISSVFTLAPLRGRTKDGVKKDLHPWAVPMPRAIDPRVYVFPDKHRISRLLFGLWFVVDDETHSIRPVVSKYYTHKGEKPIPVEDDAFLRFAMWNARRLLGRWVDTMAEGKVAIPLRQFLEGQFKDYAQGEASRTGVLTEHAMWLETDRADQIIDATTMAPLVAPAENVWVVSQDKSRGTH